jgi:hypothetical protein
LFTTGHGMFTVTWLIHANTSPACACAAVKILD